MGCTSNKAIEDANNDEINNYDERNNFYSFYPKIKRKNNFKSKNNENNDEELSNNNDNGNDNTENNENENSNKINNKNKGNKKNDDESDYINNNKDKNNSEENSNLENNNKNKDNNADNNNNENNEGNIKKDNKMNNNNSLTETNNPFKESTNEVEYYSKKLKSKKNKNEFDTTESKLMYNYKNMFSEQGEKIPEYKVYANNEKNNKKRKSMKKFKYNGIIIVEDLKEYFPKDISRDKVQELIFEAFGDNIVEDEELYIPGQTATYDQVLELSDYVFNYIKGNEKKMKVNKSLERLKVKIDLVPLDKNLINDKLFKGKDPNEKQLENVHKNLSGSVKDVKVLTIEFL